MRLALQPALPGRREAAGSEKLDQAGVDVRRTHYETRSTFRSLALGCGAVERDLDRITHPSPKEAGPLHSARRGLAVALRCGARGADRAEEVAPASVPTGYSHGRTARSPPGGKRKRPQPLGG